MREKKKKKEIKTDLKQQPEVGMLIFQGALDNLASIASIKTSIGFTDTGKPYLVFEEGVFLCAWCGNFSAGDQCQHHDVHPVDAPADLGELVKVP